MKKSGIAAIIIVLVLLIGGSIFALTRNSKSDPDATNSTSTNETGNTADGDADDTTAPATNDTTNGSSSGDTTTAAATITFNGSGFSPSTLTVKSGATVTLKNTASSSIQFSSDPHPTHTNNPELNLPELSAGDSTTFVVKKTGTWGYHDHFNQSKTGTIIVQ